MRLLLVSPLQENTNGGIAVWTRIFVEASREADIDPTVLNTAAVGKRLENGSAKRNLFDELRRTRRIFRDLGRLLKSEAFDVAHINTSCGKYGIVRDYLTAKKIKKKHPTTKIIVHYNCDIPYQIRSARSFKYLKKLAGISDENMVLCDTSLEYLRRNFGINGVKVPNFIDERTIRTSEREISSRLSQILFVGRVSKAKGAPELFEVAARFPEICFNLIGSTVPSLTVEGLPPNVHLLGQRSHDEVLRAMDSADVFFLPTHSEGFSVALLEAMARGLPTIATSVGANADMLSGGCGIVVPVGDVEKMCDAIGEMLPEEKRRRASSCAIYKVKNHYAMSKVMKTIRNCYSRGFEQDN